MEYGPTKNVLISDCTLISTSAALKIGTEGTGNFENLTVNNCIISGSNRGISIQIRDGGHVKNAMFSNIIIETRRFADCWWGCGEPISITTHNRVQRNSLAIISGNYIPAISLTQRMVYFIKEVMETILRMCYLRMSR